MAFVADFGTRNFNLKTKFDMENKTLTNHENGNDANRLLADSKNELLRKILYKSNTEYCQSAEDMQYALEEINEMIKEVYPDLEEDAD